MKNKVIILYNKLFHYRIPIFNLLAQKYDLTVVYSYPAKEEDIAQCQFKTIYVPIKKVGSLFFHKQSIKGLCKEADAVIAYGQITYVDYMKLAFSRRNYKLLFWSIGAPASYGRHYGEASSIHYAIEDFFSKRADALIFYSEKAKEMHIGRGFDKDMLFVANNTVEVEKVDLTPNLKQNLLFIGTLYLEKGLQDLLEAYKAANEISPNVPVLKMIGGGQQLSIVKDWIKKHGLSNKIELLGPIYDPQKKAELFKHALACISPKQAGLSVLESMGYGVPFVTEKNAITGGEAFNIQSGVNGIMMENLSELKDVILDISNNREKYLLMGEKAYEHYWNYRTPENMSRGVEDAIEYVLAKRNL